MRASSAARASASDASGATRRAWEISKKGNLQNLRLNERAARDARAPNECRIAVRAIGLNFADVFTVLGLYSAAPEGTFVPGLECCGEVVETASGSDFVVGDRVMCVVRFGAFADEINCPADANAEAAFEWMELRGRMLRFSCKV